MVLIVDNWDFSSCPQFLVLLGAGLGQSHCDGGELVRCSQSGWCWKMLWLEYYDPVIAGKEICN